LIKCQKLELFSNNQELTENEDQIQDNEEIFEAVSSKRSLAVKKNTNLPKH